MKDLESELIRAEEEMRAGSLERAAEILHALENDLRSSPAGAGLTEGERLIGLVKVLNNLGVVYKNQGTLEKAAESLESALEAARDLGDSAIRMRTGILSNLGLLYSRRKLYTKGLAAFDEALKLATENPDAVGTKLRIKVHNNRALFFVRFGEPEKAREELAQGLEVAQGETTLNSNREREAWLTANLGMIHAELGDEEIYNPSRQEELYRQARSMFLRSADLYNTEGFPYHRLKQLVNVAEIEIRLGAFGEARRRLNEAHREAERLRDGRLLCEVAHLGVDLAIRLGDKQQIMDRVREALQVFRDYDPADFAARQTRLEGILRRAGQREALQLLAEAKVPKDSERGTRERTPN